jgi:hypothetical protein
MREFSPAMPGVIEDDPVRKAPPAATFSHWLHVNLVSKYSPGVFKSATVTEVRNPGLGLWSKPHLIHITVCRREEQCLLKDANSAEK